MTVIDSLVPALSPDRELALAPLRARVRAAAAVLALARTQNGDRVERLACLDVARLQPRLKPEFYNTVGRLKLSAVDLLAAFDCADVPIDLRAGFRAAVAATTDSAFTSAVQALTRDADRYAGLVARVDALVRTLNGAVADLENADTIWSDTFVVPSEQFFGGFNNQPAPTSGTA